MAKEAKARIKINKLLEDSGWRLLDSTEGKANVLFENNVKITKEGIDALGENFEKTSNGFIDFLLLDDRGFPLVVLEAKSDDKSPLVGKEQARSNNRITAKEVAESLSVSLRQGERIMATLKEKGLIKRVGPNKSGHWEVIE